MGDLNAPLVKEVVLGQTYLDLLMQKHVVWGPVELEHVFKFHQVKLGLKLQF